MMLKHRIKHQEASPPEFLYSCLAQEQKMGWLN